MKIDKTAATLLASVTGVVIGGGVVGVVMLSGTGSAKTPEPVQTIQPAADQASVRPSPTTPAVSSTPVTLKVTTKAAPHVKVAPKVQEAPVTEPTTPVESTADKSTDTPPTTPDTPRVYPGVTFGGPPTTWPAQQSDAP